MGSDGVTIFILGDFAGWMVDRGETTRARVLLAEALILAADKPGGWMQASPLSGLALADAIEGEAAAAARHLGAIQRLWASDGLGRIPAHFQHRIERATALAEGRSNMEAHERTPERVPIERDG